MRIVLLGPPGSGKGTQGDLVGDRYGFPKISSGDLLRDAVQKGTPLGRKAEAFMNRGELVSDDVVVDMIRERIARPDCRNGYILDGFPRTIAQAERLAGIEHERNEIVLDIQVADQAIIQRLSQRRICSGCGAIFNLSADAGREVAKCRGCGGRLVRRDDDDPEVVRRRLEVYHAQTKPLAEYYSRKGVYRRIAGEGTVEEVFERVIQELELRAPELSPVEAES